MLMGMDQKYVTDTGMSGRGLQELSGTKGPWTGGAKQVSRQLQQQASLRGFFDKGRGREVPQCQYVRQEAMVGGVQSWGLKADQRGVRYKRRGACQQGSR